MESVSAVSSGVSALNIQQPVTQSGNTVQGGGATEESTESGGGATEESTESASSTAIISNAKAGVEQATQSAAQDTGVGNNINVKA